MKASPFLFHSDTSGETLSALGENERLHDELWLQEILRKHPSILPTAELEPIFYPLVPIGREVTAGTGSIDNLFISHRGYLVLVETKLWRNPEAKREVVAQAIDYGSSISKWTYSDLDNVVRGYTNKYEQQSEGLVEWVTSQCGPLEGGAEFFEETVAKNLRLGRFLTLIVGDKIRPSVVEMLGYINKYPHLATDLALIQLTCYRWQPGSDWPLLIVPKIIAHTRIVERSIIQVTVKHDGTHTIDVEQERRLPNTTKPRAPRTLTEEAFWELLKTGASDTTYVNARNIVESYRQRDGITIDPKDASISISVYAQNTGQPVYLFFCNSYWGNKHLSPHDF